MEIVTKLFTLAKSLYQFIRKIPWVAGHKTDSLYTLHLINQIYKVRKITGSRLCFALPFIGVDVLPEKGYLLYSVCCKLFYFS